MILDRNWRFRVLKTSHTCVLGLTPTAGQQQLNSVSFQNTVEVNSVNRGRETSHLQLRHRLWYQLVQKYCRRIVDISVSQDFSFAGLSSWARMNCCNAIKTPDNVTHGNKRQKVWCGRKDMKYSKIALAEKYRYSQICHWTSSQGPATRGSD